jgi:DNA-binding NarL/FixJ family response regulator
MTRVLLADDHPMFREGLRFTLERAGLSVVGEASDGREALRLAATTDPDVVVMDLAMPVLDGLAATEQLTASASRARVLVLTMSEDDAKVFAAVQAGAAGYLVKGVAPDQVVSAVTALAAGHAVFGPGLAHRLLDFFEHRRPQQDRFPELTGREQEVLTHLAEGLSNARIADLLVISPVTVRNHVTSILAKLQVTNRREAMLRYHAPPS